MLAPHPRRGLSPRRPQRFVQPRQQSISPPQARGHNFHRFKSMLSK